MEFVTFELAKKLKEKGYPQVKKNTIAMYDKNGNWYSLIDTFDYFEYSFEDFKEHGCICPTISQVLKWLRKEKGLHIAIDIWGRTWGYDIMELSSGNSLHWTAYREDIKSYEDAALAGIEYVLDNLI